MPPVSEQERVRLDELVDFTIDLPEGGGEGLLIDGVMYHQGRTIEVTRAKFESMREMQARAWMAQAEIDGKSVAVDPILARHEKAEVVELERLFAMVSVLTRKNTELRELMVTTATATRKDREVRAGTEFLSLVKMFPNPVESFDVEHGQFVVHLKPITLEDDGSEYEMGRFTLQLGNDAVRIYSDTGNRYPHPHVSSDGIPCWGNLGPHIAKLLGERQYAGLIAAIIEFLHSYNERDAYRRIEHWDPDHEDDD